MKVILMMAITLDGKIGKSQDHFPDWTGSEDKKLFVRTTKRAGAIIMGSKTYDTIGTPLPGRKNIVLTRNQGRKSDWDNLIYTDDPPRTILDDLAREGFTEVVLAGGSLVNSLFARERLIDDISVTVAPLVFGIGVSLFDEIVDLDLKLIHMERLGSQYVFLKYKVRK